MGCCVPACYVPVLVFVGVAVAVCIAFLPPYFMASEHEVKPGEKLEDMGKR